MQGGAREGSASIGYRIMACVTEVYGCAALRGGGIRFPSGFKGFARFAVFATAGLIAGGWMMTALGTLETVVPAFAPVAPIMRRAPLAPPQALAIVDHAIAPAQKARQSFIKAYTADSAYSNLDWRRNRNAGDEPIIAEIGPDSVIEDKPVDTASLVELRADRVRREESVVAKAEDTAAVASGNMLAYAQLPSASQAALAFSKIVPLSQAEEADAAEEQAVPDRTTDMAKRETDSDLFVPDDVPLPGVKPAMRRSRREKTTELAYAPESGATEDPLPGLSSPLLSQASRSKTAVYDISAATVYLPGGERLEAHSGLGPMRDNPRYVNQKNRGPTPPHSYNLRMREALFHGVEAIRLTPVDGKNRYNRDGLLAHTFMLGRRGDSNGCVVFRDYARFLRAFKRGEFNKLVVVGRMPTPSSTARIASLF